MAIMIPPEIDQEDPRRDGERLVFQWLSDDRIPGTVFYSLLQKNHRHKLIGEVDFLYISKRGMICFEVKGGQEILCQNKIWYSKNKRGEYNQINNPFIQAKDCSYALKRYLGEIYGKNSPQANYLVGYGVIFPECQFTGSGNDLVTEVMFDARHSLSDFKIYLDRTFDFWEELEIEKHAFHPDELTISQMTQIIDLLRGDFAVVPSLSLSLQSAEQKMVQLTEEQYDVLGLIDVNPRVIVQGSAGTGKSLLALEEVRYCAAKQKKVLYLCFNRNMALYAEHSLKSVDRTYVKVSTYHALIMDILHDKTAYQSDLAKISNMFLTKTYECPQYEYLIIDEGQDLLVPEVIDVLKHFLVNGMSEGQWTIFLDPNQNIFHPSEEFDFTWKYLLETGKPAVFPLTCNCRNTEQIARRTAALTLVPPAKKLKIRGEKVCCRSFTSTADFLKKFKKDLTSLIAGGISAKDIVILSRYKLENSLLSEIKTLCNLDLIEHLDIDSKVKTCISYYTIQSFKGLESNIVFLIDIDGFGDIQNRFMNYVAMSRAKLLLYIYYNEALADDYETTLDKGRDMLF